MNDDVQRKGMEAAGFVDIQEFEYKVRLPPPTICFLVIERAHTRF